MAFFIVDSPALDSIKREEIDGKKKEGRKAFEEELVIAQGRGMIMG